MKKIIFSLIIILLSTLSNATEVIREGQDYPIDKLREQNKKIIKMVVDEVSKHLPQKVDSYTTLIKIRDKELTLIYTFKINSGAKSDKAIIKEDKERMKRVVSRGICKSSRRFLEAGVTITYEYLSATTQKELFIFSMNQKKCKELNR